MLLFNLNVNNQHRMMCFHLLLFFPELSLVCTALRGKTKAFAEMEANFKVGNGPSSYSTACHCLR